MMPPKMPNALPRSRGGKVTWMTLSTCGYMSAAISPWSSRLATSMVGVWAKPQSALASTKPPMPSMNSRLRPKMSPSRPPVISTTA